MSSDSIKRLEAQRSYYKAIDSKSSDSMSRELVNIKNELKILNDERAIEERVITNKTGSPYLQDQEFYLRDAVYNSPEETSWKEVKSYDELYSKTVNLNMKKLNII